MNRINISKIVDFRIAKSLRLSYIHRYMKELDFRFLGAGRSRLTFMAQNNRFVLKFPINALGLKANQEESDIFRKNRNGSPDGIIYAPCRLIRHTILMMKAIQHDFGLREGSFRAMEMGVELPAWSSKVDAHQVGMLPNGKIVAYDYSHHYIHTTY
jgi:hypothetical protein